MSELPSAAHLREVRDAIRLPLSDQLHTIDQLLQRSAVLLGAASVLAGLFAAFGGIIASGPSWRHYATIVAFVALLVSILAGIVAAWPRQIKQQALPAGPESSSVAGVGTYASMDPSAFLRSQCDEAFTTLSTGDYSNIIKFRRCMFRLQAVTLVIGASLIALNGLAANTGNRNDHKPITSLSCHVPDVVGQGYSAAAAKIRAVGLIAQRSAPYVGIVESESPHAGARVAAGTVITLRGKPWPVAWPSTPAKLRAGIGTDCRQSSGRRLR